MKSKVASNMLWRLAEVMGAQAVSLVVSVILARLLAPEDYGVIAIILIFINIANVFAESGFGTALIQKKDYDNRNFSTIFYFSIVFSLFLYCILFFSAPIIAKFYNMRAICPLLRVLGFRIVLSSINTVQKAYVSKTMQFRKFFFATLGGTVSSAVIGIIMAYKGFGAWALVTQYLFNATMDTLILWFTVHWRPIAYFSYKRLKDLFGFGSKILATSLLNEVFIQLKSLVIGKTYTASDLAYVNKGQQFPSAIATGINTTVNSVMFPVMSNSQDSKSNLKQMLQKTVQTLAFLIITGMSLFAVISPSLIPFLMTDKWNSCIPFLQISCAINAVSIITGTYTQTIKAIGDSKTFMKISVLSKVANLTLLCLVMLRGVVWILLAELLVSIITQITVAIYTQRNLNYTLKEQLNDILPVMLCSLISGGLSYIVIYLRFGYMVTVLLQVIIFTAILIPFAYVFKIKAFSMFTKLLKQYKAGKNKASV